MTSTGCSAAPPPPAPPPPPDLTAAAALGDFTTVDFCSLLDLPPLTGGAKPPYTERGFYDCLVTLPGQPPTTLRVGPLTNDAQRERWETDDGSAEQRCATADKALTGVLAAVTGKRVQHVDYPAKSLARIDPCAILTGPEADTALEAEYAPSPIGFGKHGCVKAGVAVSFMSGRTAPGTSTVTVAGQKLSQLLEGTSCVLRAERPSNGRDEAVVFDADEIDAPATAASCAQAKKVAEFVLPKLPS